MEKNNTLDNYTGPHFILNHDLLQSGDIILERGYERHSEIICKQTGSRYSHAMIYVGGTIIEATLNGGVFSRIPNRSTVRDIIDFRVMRLKEKPDSETINTITSHALYLVGSKYSVTEAVLVKGPEFTKAFKENSRKQFCSRLVAQCYQKAGINLVSNINFCSPADIENSTLLMQEVTGMVRIASEEEVKHAQAISPHQSHTKNVVNFVDMALNIFKDHGIKSVGTADDEVEITTLNDISRAVFENKNSPGLDAEITEAMHSSGYLDHIEMDRKVNPYRYDFERFKSRIEYDADEHEIFIRLRGEINREADVVNRRLESYVNGKNNQVYGMKFLEAEFSIAKGMLQGLYERVVIIEKYSAEKKTTHGYKKVNDKCIEILTQIKIYAP